MSFEGLFADRELQSEKIEWCWEAQYGARRKRLI